MAQEASGRSGTGVGTSDVTLSVPTPRKACPVCGEDIAFTATKCIHCDSELNWRRHLSFSSTTLALVTALIAVLGSVGPSIKALFDYQDAFLNFTFVGSGSLRTVQPDGRPTNGSVILLGSNEGHRAGGLVAAGVLVTWDADGKRKVASSALRTVGDEPLIIGPGGATSIRLLIDPEVSPEGDTTFADVRALIVGKKPDDLTTAPLWTAHCSIGLSVAGTGPKTKEIIIPARCDALFPALRSAIRQPGIGL